jgi:2-phosphosulfolactate phosphatase
MTTVGMDADVPGWRVVVVIDVIRAFATAAVAFERGAVDIVCVGRPTTAGRCGAATRSGR